MYFSSAKKINKEIIKLDLFLTEKIQKNNYKFFTYENIKFKISTIENRYMILKELLFDDEAIKNYNQNQKLYIYNKRKIWYGRYRKYLQKFPELEKV